MLYSFEDHVALMREEKKECLSNYEKYVEDLNNVHNVEDTMFYKSVLSKLDVKEIMNSISLVLPEDLENDFDYHLLMKLVCASLSSSYDFSLRQDLKSFRLGISVTSGDESTHKYLDELWSLQVIRLFEIYVCEQMDLLALVNNPDEDKEMIEEEEEQRARNFKQKVGLLKAEKLNKTILRGELETRLNNRDI